MSSIKDDTDPSEKIRLSIPPVHRSFHTVEAFGVPLPTGSFPVGL